MDSVKLQKYFSDCGVMSRRTAEEEIRAGRVRVNGELAYLGQRILPESDTVEYKGQTVVPLTRQKVYVMLNKPRGYLTTLSDDRGRPTVASLVRDVGVRIFPVGRLDMDSDGLLILTNDGDLTLRLTHPKHEIPKIYHVTLSRIPSPDELSALGKPMVLDGYKILPVKTVLLSSTDSSAVLEMTLFEGRNRQIRRMCESVGLKITRLSRVALGSLTLGSLPCGRWRYLSEDEVEYLKGNKHRRNENA